MPTSEKLLRLKIYRQRLLRSQEQTAEARLECMQREVAVLEQRKENEFNEERREAVRAEVKRDAHWSKQRRRPCMAVYTEIYFDVDEEMFACRHAGVVAYGDTPSMACENFDHLWVFGK